MLVNKLVGHTDPTWDDMSPFVVHFTRNTPQKTDFENAISILAGRRLEARNRFGIGKEYNESQLSICFSEVPLHLISRLAARRGPHGIVFRKEFIVERNGGPIMYAYNRSPQAEALLSLIRTAVGKPNDPIWRVAPFVDLPGYHGGSPYFFEWEREWRHVGSLDFKETDPAFLIIPEELHEAARHFFDEAEREDMGPNYRCPFVDPYWGLDKIKRLMTP